MTASIPARIRRIPIIIGIDFLGDAWNNLPESAPMPRAGILNPPIISAMIFIIGRRIIAGRKIIA